MAENEGIPPAGLHPRLVRKLLDNLESNGDFRKQFQESPEQALRSLGYTDPWACLQLNGALASPEQIKAQRSKLEDTMVGIHGMFCPLDAQGADTR